MPVDDSWWDDQTRTQAAIDGPLTHTEIVRRLMEAEVIARVLEAAEDAQRAAADYERASTRLRPIVRAVREFEGEARFRAQLRRFGEPIPHPW